MLTAQRIVIYGVTGSGKTTLARQVAEATGLPFHEIDTMAWQPGWKMLPVEDQVRAVRNIVQDEAWIFDSMYSACLDEVLPRVQLIIGLDYPGIFVFFRLLRRTIRRVIFRERCCNGNVETLRLVLSRDSILLWQLKSFRSKRARLRRWCADPNGPKILLFRHPRETAVWLAQIQKDKAVFLSQVEGETAF